LIICQESLSIPLLKMAMFHNLAKDPEYKNAIGKAA
jgi:hypothetical protein